MAAALESAVAPPLPTRRLQAAHGWPRGLVSDLWSYRELLFFFVWRDIKVRYKQTALGAGWAIVQPLLTMIVFTIFFGRLARIPSDGVPYPVFSMIALVPWTYFAAALTASSTSLGGYQHVISKVYFPRLIIPLASVLAPLVDFAVAFVVLVAMMLWYGVAPGGAVVWLPFLLLLAVATAAAAGVWSCAFSVRYRDVRYVIPFAIQLWMFATPVAYPASLVPEKWRTLYALNPMVGVVEGFRWVLANREAPGAPTLVSAAVVVALLAAGIVHFRRTEGTFADIV
jgi:homopolymeric O-antigen transport system permease protein